MTVAIVLLSTIPAWAQAPGTRDPYGSDPYGSPAPYASSPAAATGPMASSDPTALRSGARWGSLMRQWRGARVMAGFANVIGLVSTGLSMSDTIYVLAAHYPPNLTTFTKPPSPSDSGQALSYTSASSSVFAFGLAAGGLAWRHHILRQLGADTGRTLYFSGTIVGLVGFLSIATSYIVGFAPGLNPHDQSIAVLATSLGGSALCNTGTLMYATDATRMQRVWKRITTF